MLIDHKRNKFQLGSGISSIGDAPLVLSDGIYFHESKIDERFEFKFTDLGIYVDGDLDLIVFSDDDDSVLSGDVFFAVELDGQLHIESCSQISFFVCGDREAGGVGLFDFDFLAVGAYVTDEDGYLIELVHFCVDEVDLWLGELKSVLS